MLRQKVRIPGIVLIILFSQQGLALPNDREQTMHVEADSADLNQLLHMGTYKGHVEFVQGSTNLHASQAITKGDNKNQLTYAKAEGNKKQQAHYWTQSEPGKPPFHAYADTIHYYPLKHRIELVGNARVEQGPNSLRAAKIIYDTLAQHVLTSSNGSTRTTIILYPEKKEL